MCDQLPIGSIILYASSVVPNGWMACKGQVLLGEDYPMLFTLLGNTYGGDGETTFGLPDLRGRVVVGGGDGYPLGGTGGQETMTLAVAHLPSHNHALNVTDATADSQSPGGNIMATESQGATATYSTDFPDEIANANSISAVGGGMAFDIRQPYIALNWIIRGN